VGEWRYLTSKPFQIRFLIAAFFLKECENIIEIGGYKMPITDFLTHDFHQAVSIDPLIDPKEEPKVLHAKEDYRYFDFKPFLTKPYGLVLLGMDLPFDFKLFSLVASAKKVIIDFPQDHLPSQVQFESLEKNIDWKVDLKLKLDFSDSDFGNLTGSYPVFADRVLYVLTPSH
jgi:hypothetical protein